MWYALRLTDRTLFVGRTRVMDRAVREKLKTTIETAFSGVSLRDGVSLNETVIIDNYGTADERAVARGTDPSEDWHALMTLPELRTINGVGGVHFFDAEGLRFHMPAYLHLALDEYEEADSMDGFMDVLLVDDLEADGRLTILSSAQRRCVLAVLEFLRSTYGLELDGTISRWEAFTQV